MSMAHKTDSWMLPAEIQLIIGILLLYFTTLRVHHGFVVLDIGGHTTSEADFQHFNSDRN